MGRVRKDLLQDIRRSNESIRESQQRILESQDRIARIERTGLADLAQKVERQERAFQRQERRFQKQELTFQYQIETFEKTSALLDRLIQRLDDLGDQIRANTRAVLRMLDRFDGPEPRPGT
jgi:hypothetical protein